MAATTPEKSRSLHNFSLPPRLSWGAQRLLRCSKVNPTTGQAAAASVDGDDHHHRRPRPHHHPYDGSSSSSRSRRRSLQSSPDNPLNTPAMDDRIEVMREKLMIDLQTEVDKIKNAILAEGGNGEADPRPPRVEARPWSLRTRRASCREQNANGCGDDVRLRFSPPPVKLPKVRSFCDGENGGGGGCGEKGERAKFSISLSREEIEEDFMELTRRRPARKPKKRAKYVQKQLDTLFPGLWLSEITADMYEVIENPEPAKGQ